MTVNCYETLITKLDYYKEINMNFPDKDSS